MQWLITARKFCLFQKNGFGGSPRSIKIVFRTAI